MGPRYFRFRVSHELKVRLGLLKKKFPTQPKTEQYISLNEWRLNAAPFFFKGKESLTFEKKATQKLKEEFEAFLNGKLKYFNADYLSIGRDYDWITNPDNDFKYDINKHWTEINDFSEESGDIKFVWEKSRFSYIYTIIRYDYHFEEDCSKIVFDEIKSWIAANPINQGPNYKCSQEISLRTLNWIFALYYYKNSKNLTEDLFQKIINTIYWQLHHVYHNINFSRISVRNNHAITETMMLYLGGLLFPFFKEAQKWKTEGKAWFEEEILYQIYEDGTFLQFSHNYHRVAIQLFTWAFYLAEANGEQFHPEVYERAKLSLSYLYQCQIQESGYLPNYGLNDGALFFKFNDATYRDYRPQLNALAYFFNQQHLYESKEVQEDVFWLKNNLTQTTQKNAKINLSILLKFPKGGIYTIRDSQTLTFLKCTRYKDRPHQADNLHVDIWYQGKNILRDAGTYKYNTTQELSKYFNGTKSHNTVTLGDYSQMQKGPRFIWLKWAEKIEADLNEVDNDYIFTGKIKAFQHIASNIIHVRKVLKKKNIPHWEIYDTVQHNTNLPIKQWWNISDDFLDNFLISAVDSNNKEISPQYEKGYFSGLYGHKVSTQVIYFETATNKIKTIIKAK